jgi:hypothetical protein
MRRSIRSVIVLLMAGAAGGYALGRRAGSGSAAGDARGAPVAGGSLAARARDVPGKLRALADLGVQQARHAVESLPGSVRIVAAAQRDPER